MVDDPRANRRRRDTSDKAANHDSLFTSCAPKSLLISEEIELFLASVARFVTE